MIIGAAITRQQAIAGITRRLVEYYQPERVYLFGSAARGDDGPDSDLDSCVGVPDDASSALLKPRAIHKQLPDVPQAFDIFGIRQRGAIGARTGCSPFGPRF